MFGIFCSSCGSQLAKVATFCQVCGITVGVEDNDLLGVAQLEVELSERKQYQTTPLTFEEYMERNAPTSLSVSLLRE